jgi:excisionase family DNA binding protein
VIEDELMTISVEEAGRHIGVKRTVAWRLVREGQLPHIRVGRQKVRVPVEALRRWIDESVTRGSSAVAEAPAAPRARASQSRPRRLGARR